MLLVVRVTILSHSHQLDQPVLVLQLLLVSQLRQLVVHQVVVTIHGLHQVVNHGKSRLLVVRDHRQVRQQDLLLVERSHLQDHRLVLPQARDHQQVQDHRQDLVHGHQRGHQRGQVQDRRPVRDLLLDQVVHVVEAIADQVLLQEVAAVPLVLAVVVALVPAVPQAGLRAALVLAGAVVPVGQAPLLVGAQAAAGVQAVGAAALAAEVQILLEVPLAAEVAVRARAHVVADKRPKKIWFL